jgi:hypothetical protein
VLWLFAVVVAWSVTDCTGGFGLTDWRLNKCRLEYNAKLREALTEEQFSTIMDMGIGSVLWEVGQCLVCGCSC